MLETKRVEFLPSAKKIYKNMQDSEKKEFECCGKWSSGEFCIGKN